MGRDLTSPRPPKAKRGFMDGYRTYDPGTEGYGSADQWRRAAEAIGQGGAAHFHLAAPGAQHSPAEAAALATLGLGGIPDDFPILRSAMRTAMMKAHPDHGGTDDAARQVFDAYALLSKRYGKG